MRHLAAAGRFISSDAFRFESLPIVELAFLPAEMNCPGYMPSFATTVSLRSAELSRLTSKGGRVSSLMSAAKDRAGLTGGVMGLIGGAIGLNGQGIGALASEPSGGRV